MKQHKTRATWSVLRQRGVGAKLSRRRSFIQPSDAKIFESLTDLSSLGPSETVSCSDGGVDALPDDLSSVTLREQSAAPKNRSFSPQEQEALAYLFGTEAVHSTFAETLNRRRHDPSSTVVSGPKTKQ